MTRAPRSHAGAVAMLADPPDLERASDGVRVRVWYRPDLARAGAPDARATVEIHYAGAPLDALDVPALNALDVYRHPAAYSSALAGALTAPHGADTYSETEDPCPA